MTVARPHGLAGPVVRELPAALVELLTLDLGGEAACKGRAPMFDDEVPGELGTEREARLHRAAATCASCSVCTACSAARLDLGREARGVWAGHTTPPTVPRTTT